MTPAIALALATGGVLFHERIPPEIDSEDLSGYEFVFLGAGFQEGYAEPRSAPAAVDPVPPPDGPLTAGTADRLRAWAELYSERIAGDQFEDEGGAGEDFAVFLKQIRGAGRGAGTVPQQRAFREALCLAVTDALKSRLRENDG